MGLESFLRRAIDELAPPRCRLCGAPAPDDAACQRHTVVPDDTARCRRCALRLPPGAVDGTRCWRCRGRPPAQASLVVVGDYGEPLRSWILAWKHGARSELTGVLAALLVEVGGWNDGKLARTGAAGEQRGKQRGQQRGQQSGKQSGQQSGKQSGEARRDERALVVPVPAHPLRRLERGHAGVEQLAREFAGLMDGVALRALRRRRATRPQGEPGASSRRANVAAAFAIRSSVMGRHSLTGRRVLLIDDVVTTGATLDEAARTLRRAGATRVDALALARAEVSSPAS